MGLDLPPAELRSAFAFSDEAAIIAGGAESSPAEVGPTGYNQYKAIHDVWLLDNRGELTALPPLTDGGIKMSLSGVQVGTSIVLGGQNCTDEMVGEFLYCWGADHLEVWILHAGKDNWTTHEIPQDLIEGVNQPHSRRSPELSVFGSSVGKAYIAVIGDEVTRFLTLDPLTGSFTVLGDGDPRPSGSATNRHCVTEAGEIIQPRTHPTQNSNPFFTQDGWNHTPQAIFAARLALDGTWHTGTPIGLHEVFGQNQPPVFPPQISCTADGTALIQLSTHVGNRDIDVLTSVDTRTLEPHTPARTDDIRRFIDARESPGIATRLRDNQILLNFEKSRLYTVEETGELSPFETFEEPTGWGNRSFFVYAGLIGFVNSKTGEVQVQIGPEEQEAHGLTSDGAGGTW